MQKPSNIWYRAYCMTTFDRCCTLSSYWPNFLQRCQCCGSWHPAIVFIWKALTWEHGSRAFKLNEVAWPVDLEAWDEGISMMSYCSRWHSCHAVSERVGFFYLFKVKEVPRLRHNASGFEANLLGVSQWNQTKALDISWHGLGKRLYHCCVSTTLIEVASDVVFTLFRGEAKAADANCLRFPIALFRPHPSLLACSREYTLDQHLEGLHDSVDMDILGRNQICALGYTAER